jgi:O-antigen ligase
LYGVIAVLLLVGLIFTRSRGGISLGILGVLLSTVVFGRRIGGDNLYGPMGSIVAFALGIGIAIGLGQVLDRFSVAAAVSDARWTILSSTLEGIGTFAPIGSGPGNYPDVYPAFQPAVLGRWFINHAHNDYAEWLFEGGLLAAALVLLFLALYARQWGRVWTRGSWPRFRFAQVGAGIGILLLGLHSLIDYNLHIPANVVYFAFMAGVFFSDPAAETKTTGRRRRPRRTPNLEDTAEVTAVPVGTAAAQSPPGQIKNPFLD